MEISELLILWYLKAKRDLPWRHTMDPYFIWLSEIILQQTRVNQGMEYYFRFINTFPDVGKLAAASEDEILKNWQGLGYYSRARNLHHTARIIQNEFGGVFPESYDGLLQLKGIGAYTAAAISSFAYNLPHAVVDGNVSRVLSRLFDVEEAINSTEGKKIIDALAEEALDQKNPGTYNQAIMELGALVCKPQNPACGECPLQGKCAALKNGTVNNRPVKIKKKKARVRHIHYAVMENNGHILFRKRTEKDIWQGLHDFFSVEDRAVADPDQMAKYISGSFSNVRLSALPSTAHKVYTHQLTHQKIEAEFWKFNYTGEVDLNSIYLNIRKEDIDQLAVPRLVHKYLEDSGLV
jgi:A/G-specific adenine glycosylase